jgi:phosphoglycolate phosphatase-like HAD superfamily hydrolase
MTSESILVFDFDGVISDSIHDSFRTALNAYIRFVPKHSFPLKEPLDTAAKTFLFEKEHPDLFARFQRIIPLGNRAEDYFTMLTMLDKRDDGGAMEQDAFTAYAGTLPPDRQKEYGRLFYAVRSELQRADPADWAGLMPAFPGFAGAVRELSERFILAVATSKDRFSVDLQLKAYGILSCFLPENIVDKDFSESKRDHLVHIREMRGVPFGSIHFIDDKLLHLVSVADLGVKCYLALWGFNTPREHALAEKEGFVLLRLTDLRNLRPVGNRLRFIQ